MHTPLSAENSQQSGMPEAIVCPCTYLIRNYALVKSEHLAQRTQGKLNFFFRHDYSYTSKGYIEFYQHL